MNPALRHEYLAALGLQSWVSRGTPAPPETAVQGREAGVDWPELRARVAACTRCTLCNTRTQTVFGVGNPTAEWLIVGEAPGAE